MSTHRRSGHLQLLNVWQMPFQKSLPRLLRQCRRRSPHGQCLRLRQPHSTTASHRLGSHPLQRAYVPNHPLPQSLRHRCEHCRRPWCRAQHAAVRCRRHLPWLLPPRYQCFLSACPRPPNVSKHCRCCRVLMCPSRSAHHHCRCLKRLFAETRSR